MSPLIRRKFRVVKPQAFKRSLYGKYCSAGISLVALFGLFLMLQCLLSYMVPILNYNNSSATSPYFYTIGHIAG